MSLLVLMCRHRRQSSANNLAVLFSLLGRSMMYIKNSSYPRTIPCGTPYVTGAGSDATPSTITLWVRPARKLLIQFKVGPQTQVLRKGRQFLLHRYIIVFTSLLRDMYVRVMVFSANFQQYFSYIVAVSFIGGGNQNALGKPHVINAFLMLLFFHRFSINLLHVKWGYGYGV